MAAMENKLSSLSRDEINRLEEALKDDKFRQILLEYADEIADPAKRKLYEEEIIQFEKERKGLDAIFIHPEPGYVIKIKSAEGLKVFVNICTNDNVECASCSRVEATETNKGGVSWNLPFLMSPCRDDTDKKGRKCQVYDVLFHKDTVYMALKNQRFKTMLEETALDGICEKFGVKLDPKVQLRFPKLDYKGEPVATLLRKSAPNSETAQTQPNKTIWNESSQNDCNCFRENYEKLECDEQKLSGTMDEQKLSGTMDEQKLSGTMDEQKLSGTMDRTLNEVQNSSCENDIASQAKTSSVSEDQQVNEGDNNLAVIVPDYRIRYRENVDLQDYALSVSNPNLRPKQILIDIHLPLLDSAREVTVDVKHQKELILESKNERKNYKLALKLAFPVYEDEGSAKFDSDTHWMSIVLPVIPFKQGDIQDCQIEEDLDRIRAPEVSTTTTAPEVSTTEITPEVSTTEITPEVSTTEIDSESSQNEVPDEIKCTFESEMTSRRKKSNEHVCSFGELVSPNVEYKKSNFICNQTLDIIAITLKINNATTFLDFRICGECNKSFQLVFEDGEKAEPYGLFLNLGVHLDSASMEGNGQVKIIKIKKSQVITEFKYSTTTEKTLQSYHFPNKENLLNKFNQIKSESLNHDGSQPIANNQVEVIDVSESNIIINIKKEKFRPIHLGKFRTCSESSEEVVSPRGILKSVWRSSSESCSEDSQSSSNHSETDIKKSVRFDDHIYKNVFRANSSILGQKKKNQKRTQHRKKMKERRTSESSDYLSSENELV